MCLTTITKRVTPSSEIIQGWKLFLVDAEGKLRFPFYTQAGKTISLYISEKNREDRVTEGRWLQAKRHIGETTLGGEGYMTGFHVFERKEHVEAWRSYEILLFKHEIVPVHCRQVRIYGTQLTSSGSVPVFVCDQLYVPQ